MYQMYSACLFVFSDEELPVTVMGSSSCVTRFVKKMLSIVSMGDYHYVYDYEMVLLGHTICYTEVRHRRT